jgi:fibronectin type 3 domain-containing protein
MSQGSAPPAGTIPPAPPAGFTATAGDSAVTLDWADNTEPDIASYTVHRSSAPGGPYTAIATDLTFSFHTDTTAANGMTYYYVVTAADASLNQSAHSDEASAAPQASPPAAPTGLVATAGGGKVSLDWTDNAEPDLASYTVYRSTTSGGVFSLIAAGLTSSNYTDNAVANDTKYFYRVTATDMVSNQSATSAEVFATPRPPNPVALTNPGFESPAEGKIANGFDGSTNVPGWNSGAMQDSGVEAASPNSGQYRAFFKGGDGGAWQTTPQAIAQGDQFTLTFHLLMSGGSGPAVAKASLVAWNGSTETVLGFQTFTAGGSWSQQTLSATVPGSATNGQSLRIKLENVGNAGSWLGMDDVALSVVNTTAPSPPTGLLAVAGDGAVDLDWADNAEPGLAGYTVYRSTTSGSGYSTVASGLTASTHVDGTVVNGTTYYYVVTATGTSSNESAASAPVSATAYTAQENWRFTHFGTTANTGNAADDADPDGDGWTNANEFAAGTDPNDRTSLLKISTLETGTQDVVIGFPTVAGKNYRVEKSATLLDGSWQTVASPVPGTGATVEITDVGARAAALVLPHCRAALRLAAEKISLGEPKGAVAGGLPSVASVARRQSVDSEKP